jgi:hypothetical protein
MDNEPIDNTNRYFKGQHKNEFIACFCRKHWIVILPTLLGFVLFSTFVVITLLILSRQSILPTSMVKFALLLAVALGTLYIHRFFMKLVNYFLDIMILTNYRIITLRKTLYMHSERDAIDMAKVQDVIKRQSGFLKNILQYGEIVITLSGASITKHITAIPNPDYHFRKINDLKREYVQKRVQQKKKVDNISSGRTHATLDVTHELEKLHEPMPQATEEAPNPHNGAPTF